MQLVGPGQLSRNVPRRLLPGKLPGFPRLVRAGGSRNHLGGALLAAAYDQAFLVLLYRRYYVTDPSHGEAAGVVRDSGDREIAGKLELLKGEVSRGGSLRGWQEAKRCLHSVPCRVWPTRLLVADSSSRGETDNFWWLASPAGISFYARPGELTALMGGSGAGERRWAAQRRRCVAGCSVAEHAANRHSASPFCEHGARTSRPFLPPACCPSTAGKTTLMDW